MCLKTIFLSKMKITDPYTMQVGGLATRKLLTRKEKLNKIKFDLNSSSETNSC